MKTKLRAKLKKYQGYASYLTGLVKKNRTQQAKGVVKVIQARAMEVL